MDKHVHHIIPKHVTGVANNHSDNLITLTVEEHAEAHRKLFEEHGRWEDKLAYRLLSGEIKAQDKIKEFRKIHSKWMSENNVSKREDVKEKIKAAWTPEKRAARSKLLRSILPGHKKSTTKNMKVPKPLLTCPHCHKIGGGHSNMYRWHFDNCSQRKI